jgi:hypothetical protein
MMLTNSQNFCSVFAIVCATTLLCGCSDNGIRTIPVHGRITYDGGEWPAAGVLYFTPLVSTGSTMRPGIAKFDKDGGFTAQTFVSGDGLIPGEYRIKVECWENPPTLAPGAPPAKSYVPQEIQLGTAEGWKVEVPPSDNVVELSLNVPKMH